MRILIVTIMLAAASAASIPTSAAEVGSCDRDGRLAGRPTGVCQIDLEAGSFELLVETFGREASGDAGITILEQDGARIDLSCLALATAIVTCEATGGELTFTPVSATLAFTTSGPATVSLRVSPPLCGTVTCTGRDPVVSAGKIIVSVAEAS